MLLRLSFLLLCSTISLWSLANQVNLVPKDTWGDLHYGSMASKEQDLFVASDGVLVLDMSNPQSPVQKSKIDIPVVDEVWPIKKLKVVANNLYVMTGKQFFIFDVTDVTNAVLKTTIDYTGANYWADFVTNENSLFIVGQDDATLSIYDISDSSSPVLQQSAPQKVNHMMDYIKLAVSNESLVISYWEEMKLLSLSANDYLSELYIDSQSSFIRGEIPVLGDVVYLTNQNSLIVYDFSNIDQVTKNTVELLDATYKDMIISDNNLYVKGTQIQQFDLTTPQTPSLITTYPQSHYIYTYMIAMADNLVLSANEKIITLDGSTEISQYSKSHYVNDLVVENNLLASASNHSLRLFDLANNLFEEVYESESGYHYSVLLNNNYMYTDTSLIYDLQDIENINLVGSFYHDTGLGQVGQLVMSNEKLISRSNTKVTNFSLASAITPIELNEIDISTVTNGEIIYSNGMAVKGNHYFAATNKGLYHFYLDENDAFQVLGRLGEEGHLTETEIVGEYLYTMGTFGVNIWNVSDLENPTLVKNLHTLAYNLEGMSFYKNWLFLPSSNQGIAVIDITNPESASVIDYLHTDSIYNPHDGVVQNNQLIVADWGQLKRFEINEAPVITTNSVQVNEDTNLVQSLDIINLEEDELSFEITTEATNGTISVTQGGEINYLPSANFNGSDSFVVKAVDQYGGDNEKTVEVTVTAINDAPILGENSFELLEDSPLSTTISASDVESDPLIFEVTEEPTSGTLTLNTDGSFDYQPNGNFNGVDVFSFTVSDVIASPVAGIVTLEIAAVNDSPSLVVENLVLDEDTSVEGQASATDIDSDSLTYSISVVANEGEAVIDTNGLYSYIPAENFNGNDSFTITVSDGMLSTDQVVEVEVAAINDTPVANESSVSGTSGAAIGGQVGANDVDGDELTFTLVNDVSNGSLSLNENGRFSYTSNAGFVGTDNFTFSVSDPDGLSSEANVKLNVTAKPVAKENSSGSGGTFGLLTLVYLLLISYRRRVIK